MFEISAASFLVLHQSPDAVLHILIHHRLVALLLEFIKRLGPIPLKDLGAHLIMNSLKARRPI